VAEVVRRQRAIGIDVPGDGEYGKAMGQRVNYGAWWSYSFQRLGGLELGMELYRIPARRSEPGRVRLTSFSDRRDRALFSAAYADPDSGVSTNRGGPGMRLPVCRGPPRLHGAGGDSGGHRPHEGRARRGGRGGGLHDLHRPGSASRIGNEYYGTEEELIFACAEAMREEYRAILDAGLVLQLDDPAMAENWDMINPEPSVEEYRQLSMIRVEALNHALRGFPAGAASASISAGGSWHGPHVTDIPLRDIVDVMLAVNCQGLFLRGGKCPPRARVEGMAGGEAPGPTASSSPAW
jgi:5-methyltetrahydropteroyltriglutamate--homocysteine methyltransferase